MNSSNHRPNETIEAFLSHPDLERGLSEHTRASYLPTADTCPEFRTNPCRIEIFDGFLQNFFFVVDDPVVLKPNRGIGIERSIREVVFRKNVRRRRFQSVTNRLFLSFGGSVFTNDIPKGFA